MSNIQNGKQYRFDYPKEFVTLPEYTAHAGQTVTVLKCTQIGNQNEEAMWQFVAADGWHGEAFESELVDLADYQVEV